MVIKRINVSKRQRVVKHQRVVKYQKGISLIEVLVAALVFGVGIVGFAALQLKSVRQVEGTYSRSQAMSIAQDLIERTKANTAPTARAFYLKATSWSGSLSNPGDCLHTDSAPDINDACTPEKMAQSDVYEVRSSLDDLISNGKINLANCDELLCVTVAWDQTDIASCDQEAFSNGERESTANCVRVEFIP